MYIYGMCQIRSCLSPNVICQSRPDVGHCSGLSGWAK